MLRRFTPALTALAFACLAVLPARAQEQLRLFDAHMHYNQEPNPYYDLEKVLEVFRRNGVTGVLATSRPNKGTHQLMDAKAPGLWVVPFSFVVETLSPPNSDAVVRPTGFAPPASKSRRSIVLV